MLGSDQECLGNDQRLQSHCSKHCSSLRSCHMANWSRGTSIVWSMFKPSLEFDLIFMLDGLEFPNSIHLACWNSILFCVEHHGLIAMDVGMPWGVRISRLCKRVSKVVLGATIRNPDSKVSGYPMTFETLPFRNWSTVWSTPEIISSCHGPGEPRFEKPSNAFNCLKLAGWCCSWWVALYQEHITTKKLHQRRLKKF